MRSPDDDDYDDPPFALEEEDWSRETPEVTPDWFVIIVMALVVLAVVARFVLE